MIRQAFSIERVVTIATPFFAAGAALFTGWLGTQTGVHLDAGAVEGVEIAAFLGTVGIVAKWLHGRQIPAIAGLHITSAQVDQVHAEVETYLKANPQLGLDVQQVVEAVLGRLRQQLGAAAAAAPLIAPSA